MTKHTHCYIGRKRCGCVTTIVVDEPEYPKDTAKSVADFIRDGYAVERMTIEDGKAALTFDCEHDKKPVSTQQEMFV